MIRLRGLAAVVVGVVASAVSVTPVASAYASSYVHAPTSGARAEVGEPLLITGTSVVGEGTSPDLVEITFDGGATWTPTDGLSWWRYVYTPTGAGDVTFSVRGSWNGHVGSPTPPTAVRVGSSGLPVVHCPCQVNPIDLPVFDADRQAVELGLRLRVDRPGSLAGASLERGAYRGPVAVSVWGPGGVLLHRQDAPAATGYLQHVTFTTPVPVEAGVEYVVSYYTPEGGYVVTEDLFVGALVQSPFTLPRDAGVYRYGGGFPTDSWNASSYAVHPVFHL